MLPTANHPTGIDIDALPPTEPIQLPLVDAVQLERTGFDSYAVRENGATLGFIDVVGRIHVVHAGPRPDRAVEVAQTLDLTTAVDRLLALR